VKILADPYFPKEVVDDLGEEGFDAVHAAEIGASDLPIREFLGLAAFEGRIVITRNRSLSRLVESDAGSWPSVIYFCADSMTASATTDTLLNLLELFDEDLKDGAIVVVRKNHTELRKFIRG